MSLLRRFLFGIALVAACHATAANSRATDAAFTALFAMPSAKPDTGSWNIPPLDDFTPGTEARLIAYLALQKKAGADFNAYRHQGSLLHHAIRAGLLKTAAWLLQHGANPRLKVNENQMDALELSIALKHQSLATLLQHKYQMKPAVRPIPIVSAVPVPPTEEEMVTKAVSSHAQAPRALDQVLATIGPAALQRQRAAALQALASAAAVSMDVKSEKLNYAVPADSWRVLWRHLPAPLAYGASMTDLASRLQPELWPALRVSGYPFRGAEDALGCLLTEIDATQLRDLWPHMLVQFPDIRQAAPRMVLSAYRMLGRHRCSQRSEAPVAAKLAFLASIGVREPVTGIGDLGNSGLSPEALAVVKPFIASKMVAKPRLVDVEPICIFTMSPAWHAALTRKKEWPVETVQLLEEPGMADCTLLVGGHERYDDVRDSVVDGFYGPEREARASCPDPDDVYEVWRLVAGKVVSSATELGRDDTSRGLIPVRDTVTGRRYYLNDGQQNGRCHGSGRRLPFAFEWRGGELVESRERMLEESLFQQCGTGRCTGIAALASGDWTTREEAGRFGRMGLTDLLGPAVAAGQGAAMDPGQQAFLAAVLALDKVRLNTMKAGGVPAPWIAQAIKAVSASALPLAYKRKRTAWLFHDSGQLAKALDAEWPAMLLGWLPYEDWRPVLGAISLSAANDIYKLSELRAAAQEKGMERLACDIDNARGWICGETISPYQSAE